MRGYTLSGVARETAPTFSARSGSLRAMEGTYMSYVSDKPRHAPPDYASLEPCVDISGRDGRIPFPEYTGSGVPIAEHPFQPHKITHYWVVDGKCGACGSENTLCIYLAYASGLGSGKDMITEVVCQDCDKYTVDTYTD
jgi:hypothetical protein